MDHKPINETLSDAKVHLSELLAERATRTGYVHADDQRIATEIATRLFHLGWAKHQLEEQNKRWRIGIASNSEVIQELGQLYNALQTELHIATHQSAPTRPE